MNKNENRLMKTAKVFFAWIKKNQEYVFYFLSIKKQDLSVGKAGYSLRNKAHVIQLI